MKFLKTPSIENKTKFNLYRNKFKTIRINAERLYYATEFCKHQNDLKTTWKLIKSAMHLDSQQEKIDCLVINGLNITDAEQIADNFNKYFVNIAKDLAVKLQTSPSSFESFMPPSLCNSMGLSLTHPGEILSIGLSLKKTHSRGIDDIDPYIAAANIHNVIVPLTEIINSSMSYGIVPTQLKEAKVVPIFKKGDKDNLINYRPISILPYFAKYFEKVMYERLSSYIAKADILQKTQYGFQQNRSTYMALLDMEDKITKAIDNNEFSVGIFIDLAKAFDTVDHTILLKKMFNYGIRGIQLQWFSSYLTNRTQRVSCNGAFSNVGLVTHGVPQGSNLGPLLFLLYINDLSLVSSTLYFILFADDTNIFYSNKSHTELTETVNRELKKLNYWFLANRLTLNVDKTNFISFKSHRKIKPTTWALTIDDQLIKQVDSTKFLGVFLDQHLSWKTHINYISQKISKNIGVISRISYLLPKHIRLNLYYALVFPYLSYCALIWSSTYKSRIKRVITLQKKAIRTVEGVSRNTSTSPIFRSLNLLSLNQIKKIQIGEFMYKFEHNQLPDTFAKYFTLGSQIHGHHTRNALAYRPVKARTNIRLFSIRINGPTFFNSIPLSIRQAKNRYEF